jgi:hypothetical protein
MIYIAESKTTVKPTCACPKNASCGTTSFATVNIQRYDGRLLQNKAKFVQRLSGASVHRDICAMMCE